MAEEQKRKSDQEYEDRFWETYLNLAAEEDKHLPDNWEANTGGILTFVSTPRYHETCTTMRS